MNSEQLLERARLLISQHRPEQAEPSLRQALSLQPGDGFAHGLLALCVMRDRDRLREATEEAEQAIHTAPDQAYPFYVHALVMEKRNLYDDAMRSVERAIEVDPTQTSYHGLKSALLVRKGKWADALVSAEAGLQFDPEDQQCAGLRSISLERLGRVEDALGEANRAVARDPDSGDAHASRGWALLNQGDYRQAQQAFREALRLNPSSEFARQGMIQSLNSSNIIFRLSFRAMMWLSRLDSRYQWGLILGLWVGMRLLNSAADRSPGLRPYVLPISIVYLLLVMMTWLLHPLFNTLLRFHPFGRHLLSRKEKWASNLIAATLLTGVVAAVAAAATSGVWVLLVLPIVWALFLAIPVSVAFKTADGWPTFVSATIAVLFTLMFLLLSGILVAGYFPSVVMIQAYSLGILIYCFASQWLMTITPSR